MKIIIIIILTVLLLIGCSQEEAQVCPEYNVTELIKEKIDLSCNFPAIKDYSSDLQDIKTKLGNIKLVCPEQIVEEADCDTDEELLSMGMASFRYNVMLDNYDRFKEEVEDDNYQYCLDNYQDIVDDIGIIKTYVSEYSEGVLDKQGYNIWVKTSKYLQDYIKVVKTYCSNKNEPDDSYYNDYIRYHQYYDFVINETEMPKLTILEEVHI